VVAARYEYTLKLIPSGARRILDVGCGDGYLLYRLILKGKEAWGVDTFHEGLLAGQAECHQCLDKLTHRTIKLVRTSGLALPLRKGQFDMVILTEVLEHVVYAEALLESIKRVLTSSGLFILSTPNRGPRGYHDS
jgi:2-polyprenyl-6-hydroxyphenyl methylase/3-demethylubiquinone-9 3-methyltransferase